MRLYQLATRAQEDVLYTLERPRIFALECQEASYKKPLLSGRLRVSPEAPAYKMHHYMFAPDEAKSKERNQPANQEQPDAGDELLVKDSNVSVVDINDGYG